MVAGHPGEDLCVLEWLEDRAPEFVSEVEVALEAIVEREVQPVGRRTSTVVTFGILVILFMTCP